MTERLLLQVFGRLVLFKRIVDWDELYLHVQLLRDGEDSLRASRHHDAVKLENHGLIEGRMRLEVEMGRRNEVGELRWTLDFGLMLRLLQYQYLVVFIANSESLSRRLLVFFQNSAQPWSISMELGQERHGSNISSITLAFVLIGRIIDGQEVTNYTQVSALAL